MKIDWWTLALQAVNFLVLVWLLWRFLYRPVREVIEKRKALADAAFAEADAKKAATDSERQRFEADRAALAQERQDLLKRLHEELDAERAKILAEARAKADAMLAEAKSALEGERAAAFKDLRGDVSALATSLAGDLLTNIQKGLPDDIQLAHLQRQLADLPDGERDRLAADLEGDGARLDVVTAAPLPPDAQAAWAARLEERFGHADRTGFVVEPGIVGGFELRFPHAVLKLSWADQLQKARKLLEADETAA